MKILLVDDEASLLYAMRAMLAEHRYEVDCLDNASEAVAMAEEGGYDLVLIDYRMPDNDGLWFMEHVKLPRGTKALLMTGHVNREIIKRMFKLGVSGYLIKPFRDQELLLHLDYYTKRCV
jgi:CheY-like chemotaxis protein